MARIGIFGAGYVGLVTGACLADLGHEVTVRDIVPEKIDALNGGRVPIHEPGLEELLAKNADRLRFTLDVREAIDGAEFLFVAVDTPPTHSGDADLSRVWSVIDELSGVERVVLVMKSTVPVGTGEKVRSALRGRGLGHVGYVSNPEFLAEGTGVYDFLHPDRIVIGSFADSDGAAVEGLFAGVEAPVVRTDVASAEMIKMASNAFLSARISFINEIANVCELVGADVTDVAKGVGLDHRLGPHFLHAGIGFGGSCLVGEETVLVRSGGRSRLLTLESLFDDFAPAGGAILCQPDGLEVLAWREGAEAPEWFPVAAVTRRPYTGDILEVRTKMGRRVRCTPDHPFVVRGGATKVAEELTTEDWLPIAQGIREPAGIPERLDLLTEPLDEDAVIVRPYPGVLEQVGARRLQATLEHPRGAVARSHDIVRSGAVRLSELRAAHLPLEGAMLGTAENGTYVPPSIQLDEELWRIVGLYIAEGHCSRDGARRRLQWSFHPDAEFDLVDEVVRFWRFRGVRADVRFNATSAAVVVSSRLLASWWLERLALGANCHEQRIPDLIWDAPLAHKRALLAGLWRGDGSWSYVAGGPSVVLEYGTVSRELADGILRLLGEFGVTARLKVGRTRKSAVDTYWLVIAGADQVERLLDLVPERDREAIRSSLARQTKRIAPTGYRRDGNASWVRVVQTARRAYDGFVYSLEVPGAHTFVTTGGLVVHNCFPKDIAALKQLAGNIGYHFQLLSAVIEVNDLQRKRVVQKLQKYLGPLGGTTIALLGLSFKPNTDDMREAPSIVLASRLFAEGAQVRGWDPIADATGLLPYLTQCATPLDAVAGADAAVIVTEWPELANQDWPVLAAAMKRPLLIDGRNFLDPREARQAGFVYEGIGRGLAWNGVADEGLLGEAEQIAEEA